ncbi:MAG: hypothetical protein A3F13_01285 [Gammaproteobacteria bacterium RIFCSPHIGHO2_12_FULL_40_19]|nr:MAG: hypothetical protein A3F13_01285 [Gammaproteobacteria bacterium RIFCSPHIGHO2_12_FULL_40_19]
MKPTQSLVVISLCAGMALSAFANTASNACDQIRQRCTSNNLSQATCERRVEQCHHQMAKRHEHQVQMSHNQQNNAAAAAAAAPTQQRSQPSAQQASPQANAPATQQPNQ